MDELAIQLHKTTLPYNTRLQFVCGFYRPILADHFQLLVMPLYLRRWSCACRTKKHVLKQPPNFPSLETKIKLSLILFFLLLFLLTHTKFNWS